MSRNEIESVVRPVAARVLIADADTERAHRLAAELAREGIAADVAATGVEALERALIGAPSLVIAAQGLALVDAPRLAELVAANPRTADAHFLFVGDFEASGLDVGVGDRCVPAILPAKEVCETARLMLEQFDCLASLDWDSDGGEGARGRLSQLSAADLLSLLHRGGRTGRLKLFQGRAASEAHGEVFLRDGEVIAAECGSARAEKAFFRMYGWREGNFCFGPLDDDSAPQIRVSTRALLAEGQRQLVEWNRIPTRLPELDARVCLHVRPKALPAGVHPLTQQVIALLGVHERVGDIVDHCSFPDYQVLRTLQTLTERKLVSLQQAPSGEELGIRKGALLGDTQARRLREWMRDSQGGSRGPLKAKLLVVASEPTAVADFANLLRLASGFEVSTELDQGKIGPHDLAVLGRVEVADDAAIELLHVPTDARFEPLWPIAAHGSLGIIFLLSGPVGEAVRRVQPMVDALEEIPRIRFLYTVLLAKGERVNADELHEHLSLIDEGALVLIPLDAAKDPAALLARMFARVVP
jgi:hypothetical protein